MVKRKRRDVALEIAEKSGSPDRKTMSPADEELLQEVEEFQIILSELEDVGRYGSPPEHLLSWARAWAGQEMPEEKGIASRVLGILSRQSMPAHALRSGVTEPAAVLYGDEDYQLDLRVEEIETESWRIRGQVVSLKAVDDHGCWKLRLLDPSGKWTEQSSDEFGEFTFAPVAAGSGLSLSAQRGKDRLHVARIEGPGTGKDR